MFLRLEDMRQYSTYTMRKKTQYSEVSLEALDDIPVIAKKYHSDVKLERYEMERDILIDLNGKWRTPRLLACNNETRTLYIEWIAGDRLREYMFQRYLGLDDIESYRNSEMFTIARKRFKSDRSPEAMNIKTQVFSIVRLLHRFGIAHGDLDSRNFIINPDSIIYVIDFSNGKFPQPDSKFYQIDRNRLKEEFGISWRFYERNNALYLKEYHYQSCVYPNGLISTGDGQGSTYRKFRHLGIKNLDGFSFLDIGCAEGEICRYAYRKGAKHVLGIDINPKSLDRGRKINFLYGYHSVTLKKGDVLNLAKSTDGEKYDVVTCFSVLQHLLPDGKTLDMLAIVTDPKQDNDRTLLVSLINEILSVTNLILFLELPFLYLGVSTRTLETGLNFFENVAPDIQGSIRSLGIWHANDKKACFVFRIDKLDLSLETEEKILLSDTVLDAWHRNIPMVPFKLSTRIPPTERINIMKCAAPVPIISNALKMIKLYGWKRTARLYHKKIYAKLLKK